VWDATYTIYLILKEWVDKELYVLKSIYRKRVVRYLERYKFILISGIEFSVVYDYRICDDLLRDGIGEKKTNEIDSELKVVIKEWIKTGSLNAEIIGDYIVQSNFLREVVEWIDNETQEKIDYIDNWAKKLGISTLLLRQIIESKMRKNIKIIDKYIVNKEFKKERLKIPPFSKTPEKIAKLNNTTPAVIRCILYGEC